MLIPRPFFVSFIIGFLTKLGVVVRKKIVKTFLFSKLPGKSLSVLQNGHHI